MIVHLHRKKKKCFFRINTDSGITCQAVCTDSHNPVGGVGHIRLFQYSLPEVEGLSSPLHPKSLSTLGSLDGHDSHLRKADIGEYHCLHQNVIHCRKSKIRLSMWDFTSWEVEAAPMSLFIFFPPKNTGNIKRSSNRCFYEEQQLYRYIYHVETPQIM